MQRPLTSDDFARLRLIAGAASGAESIRPYATKAQHPLLEEVEQTFRETFTASVVCAILDELYLARVSGRP